jgi:murein endopeptidase
MGTRNRRAPALRRGVIALTLASTSSDARQWQRRAVPRGTPTTLQSIRTLATALDATGIVIGVGDISFAQGGKMPPHGSHRRGVDVDLRPQRTDEARSPVSITDAAYSHDRTLLVVQELQKDPNLDLILFNDRKIDGVRFYEGHHNHLHCRFKA